MKIKLFILILFIAFSNGFAQSTDMGALKVRTEQMYTASYNIDLKTVMDLTYPKVFDIVDRETLLSAMENVFKNESLSISFIHPKVDFTYSDIKTIDGKKFNVIKYKNTMRMTLNQEVDPEGVEAMTEGLKSSGKFQTVTYDEKTNSFVIEGDSILIAVADETTKNLWTFVNYDDDQLFKLVFDDNIKTGLGL